MNLNGIQSPEQLLAMGMMQNVLKKSFGDGMEFELVLESLLQSMNQNTNESTTDSGKTNELLQVNVGQKLQDIPLRINNSFVQTSNIGATSSVSTNSSSETMQRIYSAVNKYASEYGIDPKLALAVIKTESDFNPNVVSSAGAMGLMQLMPVNCEEDGVSDPFNIEENVRGGIKQLKGHIDRYNGSVEMALMAYNAGQGTVQRRGVTSANDLYKMPTETQNYVPKVMNYYKSL